MKLLVQQKREALRGGLLEMGGKVVTALRLAIDCLRGRDLKLAREIIANDIKINHFRRETEQRALLALAAYQPAGDDFRARSAPPWNWSPSWSGWPITLRTLPAWWKKSPGGKSPRWP